MGWGNLFNCPLWFLVGTPTLSFFSLFLDFWDSFFLFLLYVSDSYPPYDPFKLHPTIVALLYVNSSRGPFLFLSFFDPRYLFFSFNRSRLHPFNDFMCFCTILASFSLSPSTIMVLFIIVACRHAMYPYRISHRPTRHKPHPIPILSHYLRTAYTTSLSPVLTFPVANCYCSVVLSIVFIVLSCSRTPSSYRALFLSLPSRFSQLDHEDRISKFYIIVFLPLIHRPPPPRPLSMDLVGSYQVNYPYDYTYLHTPNTYL